jgi:hypothetical protein
VANHYSWGAKHMTSELMNNSFHVFVNFSNSDCDSSDEDKIIYLDDNVEFEHENFPFSLYLEWANSANFNVDIIQQHLRNRKQAVFDSEILSKFSGRIPKIQYISDFETTEKCINRAFLNKHWLSDELKYRALPTLESSKNFWSCEDLYKFLSAKGKRTHEPQSDADSDLRRKIISFEPSQFIAYLESRPQDSMKECSFAIFCYLENVVSKKEYRILSIILSNFTLDCPNGKRIGILILRLWNKLPISIGIKSDLVRFADRLKKFIGNDSEQQIVEINRLIG